MSYLEAQNYHPTNFCKRSQKEFFISDIGSEQTVLTTAIIPFPVFSISNLIPKNLFSFSGTAGLNSGQNPRFKMILWSIIAGTRGGANRVKILNLIKDTPSNANKIATVLNLDHKTVIHHVKILSKNNLVVKAEKAYAAEFELSQIMKENQIALEEIMQKIASK
ncbi:winged helix-turn-helix domain-containing protein [Nitrosopumilus sp.]|uniref:winged helix-turn-helix domain-containing protein n=1 Tax=Nitrosopumilus sp. TaxID=2024843 RepID=UPI002930DD58|nr:winged helix-turn-helix domain-containing protein [Nitrosopumilus sp.]